MPLPFVRNADACGCLVPAPEGNIMAAVGKSPWQRPQPWSVDGVSALQGAWSVYSGPKILLQCGRPMSVSWFTNSQCAEQPFEAYWTASDQSRARRFRVRSGGVITDIETL